MKLSKINLKKIRENAKKVLGINQRNLNYIYPNNSRKHYPLADNKILTKEVLGVAGIKMPKTYKTYSNFFELKSLDKDLEGLSDFVIKPAGGRGGGGIIVIKGHAGEDFIGISGRRIKLTELKKHISDIIFGVYSFDLYDSAIIEERVKQNSDIEIVSPYGLADLRVILFHHVPVLAMMRVPTLASDGKANLHMGSVGVGLDFSSGKTINAILDKEPIESHPDTGHPLIGIQIPYWEQVLMMSEAASLAVPLKYLGVDISLSTTGPVLLEINVRPGLEIQNANQKGLRRCLEALISIGVNS
ncbi:MAG: sugar-transfer associated ATP-grasp domain-containing protein [Thermodesulfobacteriota bacterium]